MRVSLFIFLFEKFSDINKLIWSFVLTFTKALTPLKSGEAMVAAPVAFHSFFAGLVSYEPLAFTVQSCSLRRLPAAEPENLSLAKATVVLIP